MSDTKHLKQISLYLVVLLVVGIFAFFSIPKANGPFPVAHSVKESAAREGIYAVFLTNNQVYFGSIGQEDDKTLNLKNVFYIQPKPEADQKPANDIALMKMGSEIHGPQDAMEIYKEQVLFIERLKEDGKVGKAIKAYQAQQAK